MSIDFSSRQFSVNSSTVPYNIALTGQNRKEIVCAQNQKNSADDDRWNRYRRWWTTGSGGERSEWTKRVHTASMHYFQHGRHDGVGPIFTRHYLQKLRVMKVGTQKRRKTAIYYGKVYKRPSKVGRRWPDGLNDEVDCRGPKMFDRPLLVNAVTVICLMLL